LKSVLQLRATTESSARLALAKVASRSSAVKKIEA
jgi:hypothetical protein